MNRDDIIRLAVEAKLVSDWDGGCTSAWVEGHDLTPYLERFAALVAASERERAILIAKNMKEELQAKFEQTYMEGVIAGAAAERKRLLDAAECCRMREHGGVCYEKAKGNEAD